MPLVQVQSLRPYRVFITNLRVGSGHSIFVVSSFCMYWQERFLLQPPRNSLTDLEKKVVLYPPVSKKFSHLFGLGGYTLTPCKKKLFEKVSLLIWTKGTDLHTQI